MKGKRMALALGLILSLLCALSACGKSKPPQLSGTYCTTSYGTTMSYTFDKDTVTVQYFTMGYEVVSYEGTYAINDGETQIILAFDPAQMENAVLPTGLASLGGAFTFQRGEGYIVIGMVRYDQSDGVEATPQCASSGAAETKAVECMGLSAEGAALPAYENKGENQL